MYIRYISMLALIIIFGYMTSIFIDSYKRKSDLFGLVAIVYIIIILFVIISLLSIFT